MPRTITFQTATNRVATRLGLDPDNNDGDLAPSQAAAIAEYLRYAYELAYEWGQWPETILSEQRTPVAQLIAWSQASENTIGTVFSVTELHPLIAKNPIGVKFRLGADGIYLPSTHVITEVYVNYRRPAPQFTTTAWNIATAYAVGDTVYYSTTGECYAAIAATTGDLPTDTANWEKLDFLRVIADAAVQGAMSEARAEEGQHTVSGVMDQKMEALLEHEFDRLTRQSGQSEMIRMDDFNVN